MITLPAVGAAAAVGAVAGYVLDQYVQYRSPGVFPCGTWLINITGSFVLGLLTGLGARHGLPEQGVPIVGVGFCGAHTTFSTFSYELVHLREKGQVRKVPAVRRFEPRVGSVGGSGGASPSGRSEKGQAQPSGT